MISKEEVLHIAKLARLELSEAEVSKMQKDLSSILDYFNVLKKAKSTKGKGKSATLHIEKVTRKDKVEQRPASLANKLISAAPSKQDDYIKVKQIL